MTLATTSRLTMTAKGLIIPWLLISVAIQGCGPEGRVSWRDADLDGIPETSDCDDEDKDVGTAIVFYADMDCDGGGDKNTAWAQGPDLSIEAGYKCPDPPPGLLGTSPIEGCIAGWVHNHHDCDDLNPNLNIGTTWYADDDSDGYVDYDTTITACLDPNIGSDSPVWISESEIPEDADGELGDCDDAVWVINPGALEVCDGIDNNCDGLIDDDDPDIQGQNTWYQDADGDGFFGQDTEQLSCENPGGIHSSSEWETYENIDAGSDIDCDDEDDTINGDAPEICDGIDNNCNGLTDDNDPNVQGQETWYLDADGDGFLEDGTGSSNGTSTTTCENPNEEGQPPTWIVESDIPGDQGDDCNDSDPAINPGAFEDCSNGIDNDCDGQIDEGVIGNWYPDADGDGEGQSGVDPEEREGCPDEGFVEGNNDDCNDEASSINTSADEVCDEQNTDENCNDFADDKDSSTLDEGKAWYYIDADTDGFGSGEGQLTCDPPTESGSYSDNDEDCDDLKPAINPDATEICDGLDNNCDGLIDDADPNVDLDTGTFYYPDVDGDGYGLGETEDDGQKQCTAPNGYVDLNGDCDDGDSAYHPNAAEDDCTAQQDYNCDGATGYQDSDGDGSPACEDCNDTDGNIYPDAQEICDDDDTDEDCNGLADDEDPDVDSDGMTSYYVDNDRDTYGDEKAPEVRQCDPPLDQFGYPYATNNLDCDDEVNPVNPGATEVCDDGNTDENCNGKADDNDPTTNANSMTSYYTDADGDNYAASGTSIEQCEQPNGTTTSPDGYGDCNDRDPSIHPGAYDAPCNGKNEDCDDATLDIDDSDNDTYDNCPISDFDDGKPIDCNDDDDSINPDAEELCDNIDNDCDGNVEPPEAAQPTWYLDVDSDGYGDSDSLIVDCDQPNSSWIEEDGDCDDDNAEKFPGNPEICDATDNDCDNSTDEGLTKHNYYPDDDTDGYGDLDAIPVYICSGQKPEGSVTSNTDCDDGEFDINPGKTESCDAIDNDCDDNIDEGIATNSYYPDNDEDTYGNMHSEPTNVCQALKPSGYLENNTDCDDSNDLINPGETEICNYIDDNCNNQVDENLTVEYYPDRDGDGYGDEDGTPENFCPGSAPDLYAEDNTDCDDGDDDINPGATEFCLDTVDSNCNGFWCDGLLTLSTFKQWSFEGGSEHMALGTSVAAIALSSEIVLAAGDPSYKPPSGSDNDGSVLLFAMGGEGATTTLEHQTTIRGYWATQGEDGGDYGDRFGEALSAAPLWDGADGQLLIGSPGRASERQDLDGACSSNDEDSTGGAYLLDVEATLDLGPAEGVDTYSIWTLVNNEKVARGWYQYCGETDSGSALALATVQCRTTGTLTARQCKTALVGSPMSGGNDCTLGTGGTAQLMQDLAFNEYTCDGTCVEPLDHVALSGNADKPGLKLLGEGGGALGSSVLLVDEGAGNLRALATGDPQNNKVYIYNSFPLPSGKTIDLNVNDSDSNPLPELTITAPMNGANVRNWTLGTAMAYLGDIDGDGIGEMAILMPLLGDGGDSPILRLSGEVSNLGGNGYAGGILILRGTLPDGDVTVSDLLASTSGDHGSAEALFLHMPAFSYIQSVTGADLNGDGFSDLAVRGENEAGKSYIWIFYGADREDGAGLMTSDAGVLVYDRIEGPDNYDLGYSMSNAGDLDDDGDDELLLGAPCSDSSLCNNGGRIYILKGWSPGGL